MRKIFGNTVLRTSAFALACLALAGTDSRAGVMQTYSTGGTILGSGISSPNRTTPINVASIIPVVSGAFTSPSAVSLGQFQVATLADGRKTTYDKTPFTLTYNPLTITGVDYPVTGSPVTITGTLSGDVTGDQSTVVATFDPITSPVFASADGKYLNTLSVLNSPLNLVPASAGGITTIQAQVVTVDSTTGLPVPAGEGNEVPEPTTLAILATSLVGFGLRQRLRARKSA